MDALPIASLVVEAVSLSLLHTLWQGCAVTVLAVAGYWMLRNAPQQRYCWGLFCLLLMIACPIVTFCWIYQPITKNPFALENDALTATGALEPITVPSIAPFSVDLADDAQVPKPWPLVHASVVCVWLLGQLVIGLRLSASARFVYRLKRLVQPVPQDLRRVAERLARRIGVRCPQVASSTHVASAMAAGFFRHTIVIPTAWLTEMTPEMLEAVIAHELAHIRRGDLWINLLQRLAESFLFFHPTVWWLTRKLRMDREICCDLRAVHVTNQPKQYAKTLERVAYLQSTRSACLVTPIGDERMSLLHRVQLVLGQPTNRTTLEWWPIGAIVVAVPCMLFWLSHSDRSFADEPTHPPETSALAGELATNPYAAADDVVQSSVVVASVINELSDETPATEDEHDAKSKLGPYIIEPPDVVAIEVIGPLVPKDVATIAEGSSTNEEDAIHSAAARISGKYLVGPDGTINLGETGPVFITGLTIDKATEAVRSQLSEHFEKPELRLNVWASNSKVYYVIEQKGKDGDYVTRAMITGNESVLDAIAQIGGVGNSGSQKLYISRPSPQGASDQILPIDWAAITNGDTTTNYQLLPGDRLFIKSVSVDPDVFGYSPNTRVGERNGVRSGNQHGTRNRIPIMGPATSGPSVQTIDPPSDEQILALIRIGSPDSTLLLPVHRDQVVVEAHLIASYVDPPKTYPLIGNARLHHAHYKCVVGFHNINTNTLDRGREIITLYVDHTHLHVGDKPAGAQGVPSENEIDLQQPSPWQG